MHKLLLVLLFCGLGLSYAQSFQWNNATVATPPTPSPADPLADQTGLASVYPDYYEGNPTALGEVFHQYEFTAAHAKLPLGSLVEVTRLDNGLSTTVRINDRGAFCEGCIIDLSKAAAQQLGLEKNQQTRVKLTVTGFRQSAEPVSVALKPQPTDQPRSTDTQFTVKGVSSPHPNSFPHEAVAAASAPQPSEVHTDASASASNLSASVPKTSDHHPADHQVQLIDHLPAPYAVQLGSYNHFSNAERHAIRLQQSGFNNVFILQEKEVGHEPLNRVLITPFYTLSETEDFVEELQQYHQMRALILQNKLVEIAVD